MSETYTLAGREYPIIGYDIHPATGLPTVPLLDITMISEERLAQKSLESWKRHREHCVDPAKADQEIASLEKWLAEHSPA